MNRPSQQHKQHELREKRKELHGKRRELHEQLSEACEAFVTGPLTKEHKQKALVRELRYMLDYYQDEDSWKGID